MPLSFLSSKKAFRSHLMIFKCAWAICLCSFTVDSSYVSSTGEVSQWKLETVWHLLESIVLKRFDNVNICQENFKFAMLSLPINPLGHIVYGLYGTFQATTFFIQLYFKFIYLMQLQLYFHSLFLSLLFSIPPSLVQTIAHHSLC